MLEKYKVVYKGGQDEIIEKKSMFFLYAILNDKVNKNNINQVIDEWNDFIDHGEKSCRKNINT